MKRSCVFTTMIGFAVGFLLVFLAVWITCNENKGENASMHNQPESVRDSARYSN